MLARKSFVRGAVLAAIALPAVAQTLAQLVAEIGTLLTAAEDCSDCLGLLVPMQVLASLGDQAFVGGLVALCEAEGLEDPDVCAGAIGEQGPILAHDLRLISTTGQTAVKFCEAVFGLCTSPPVNALNVSFPKPAPTTPQRFMSRGRKPFQVMHFSDVHIDRQYTVGSEANCTKPICCRNFADETGPPTVPAGPSGNSRCDSPVKLADAMLSSAQRIGASAKFSIFTGDVVEGAVWLVSQTEVTADLTDFNDELAAMLKAPVFPSLGNHDSAPVNAFPRDTTNTTMTSQWVFDTQSAGWERWINATAAAEVQHMSGSYTALVPDSKLRIIAVNTQYWYKQNFWMYDTDAQQPDPNGILAFMVQALQMAEDAGQRAWIIGHIPTGKLDTFSDQSNYYDQIVQRYKNTIAAQFFGHSHQDQFEIAYSDYLNPTAENAVSVQIIGPALTPTSGNPAFKLYDIDPDTYEIMDAKVFFSNVSLPNFQDRPTFSLYYSARESYGRLLSPEFTKFPLPPTQALDAAFWHNLTALFDSNTTKGDAAFALWNARLHRGVQISNCTGTCQAIAICDMRAARAENNCDPRVKAIAFRRSMDDIAAELHESSACEGVSVGSIFRKIARRNVLRSRGLFVETE